MFLKPAAHQTSSCQNLAKWHLTNIYNITSRSLLVNDRRAEKFALNESTIRKRYTAKVPDQMMGDLPYFRVNVSSSFARSGVDCAGLIAIRLTKSHGKATMKGWICLFVCLVIRGVYLKLVEDYSAEALIAAFHRFTSRWGYCTELVSNNGTNLVGADRQLRLMLCEGSAYFNEICPYLALGHKLDLKRSRRFPLWWDLEIGYEVCQVPYEKGNR